jgi:hypothetical protein
MCINIAHDCHQHAREFAAVCLPLGTIDIKNYCKTIADKEHAAACAAVDVSTKKNFLLVAAKK